MMSLGLESIAHFLFGFGSCANDDETLLLLPLIPRDETVCNGLSEARTTYYPHDFLSRVVVPVSCYSHLSAFALAFSVPSGCFESYVSCT